MPQESLNKLTEFRFQRKPTVMSKPFNSSFHSDVKRNTATEVDGVIEILDSDSDNETNTPAKTANPSSQDDIEKILDTIKATTPSQDSGQKVVNKFDTVQEKELKVRYLIKMYPAIESFEVYQILSEFNFAIHPSVEKLIKQHKKEPELNFEAWKTEYYKTHPPDPSKSTYTNVQSNRSTSAVSNSHQTVVRNNNIIRANNVAANQSKIITTATPTKTNTTSITTTAGSNTSFKRKGFEHSHKKVKRQRVHDYDDSDDSGDVKEYKDNRVYDSSDDDSDKEITNELTSDKKRVLQFLQTATPNELQMMPSCSKKKIDAIIASRPFDGWIDLVQKLQENKNLSTDLLNAAQHVLITRNNIKKLMKKCTNLSSQLAYAISKEATVKEQPQLLTPSLHLTSYQLVGLNWLAVLHKQDVNGILADEMGLGKTVQVISFLAYLKEINAAKAIHLVVVPSSTLENWQNEFTRWCPALNVLLYYGSIEERRELRALLNDEAQKNFDVILTTYTMVSSTPEEKKMFRVTPMHYVVFDEAHMLKNMNTQRYENLIRIKASKRILLTGTPLQNNLLELMSLLIFVMPNIFSEKTEDLKNLFQKTSKKDADNDSLPQFEKEQIEHAKKIMKPFVLRRLKRDVLQDLPKKDDTMLEVPMAPTQLEQYVNLVASFKEAGNTGSTSYSGVAMMSDLRKLSNHPLLLRYHYQYEDLPEIAKKLAADPGYKDTVVQYIVDDLACMSDFEIHTMTKDFKCLEEFALPENLILTSGKFLYLDKKLEELKNEGHRVLIFSQYVILLNVMEDYLQLRNHKYLRLDGSTPVNIRQQLIDDYSNDPSIFIFLLSTRAGGLGINLTAADTVIIHDIDFNPYNDKQAEDRCHRMGQEKPVSVYRLISKGTIEEGMWQLTQEKLKLEKEITNDDYEKTDVKSVVNLLSSALGIDTDKATNLVSPQKKVS